MRGLDLEWEGRYSWGTFNKQFIHIFSITLIITRWHRRHSHFRGKITVLLGFTELLKGTKLVPVEPGFFFCQPRGLPFMRVHFLCHLPMDQTQWSLSLRRDGCQSLKCFLKFVAASPDVMQTHRRCELVGTRPSFGVLHPCQTVRGPQFSAVVGEPLTRAWEAGLPSLLNCLCSIVWFRFSSMGSTPYLQNESPT